VSPFFGKVASSDKLEVPSGEYIVS
jgi:hypothetical protein